MVLFCSAGLLISASTDIPKPLGAFRVRLEGKLRWLQAMSKDRTSQIEATPDSQQFKDMKFLKRNELNGKESHCWA